VRALVGIVGLSAVAALLAFPSLASAERSPTFKEREAITAALPKWFQREPVGCVWLEINVSRNGRYAIAGPNFLNVSTPLCGRYAANGLWILKKTSRWRVIFNGSDPPPCSLAIPKDLVTGCLRR
jgi:hypothetical protein